MKYKEIISVLSRVRNSLTEDDQYLIDLILNDLESTRKTGNAIIFILVIMALLAIAVYIGSRL